MSNSNEHGLSNVEGNMGQSLYFRKSATGNTTIERLSLNSLTDLQIFVLKCLVDNGRETASLENTDKFLSIVDKIQHLVNKDWALRGKPVFKL